MTASDSIKERKKRKKISLPNSLKATLSPLLIAELTQLLISNPTENTPWLEKALILTDVKHPKKYVKRKKVYKEPLDPIEKKIRKRVKNII